MTKDLFNYFYNLLRALSKPNINSYKVQVKLLLNEQWLLQKVLDNFSSSTPKLLEPCINILGTVVSIDTEICHWLVHKTDFLLRLKSVLSLRLFQYDTKLWWTVNNAISNGEQESLAVLNSGYLIYIVAACRSK